jgi:DUF2075 family protein
MSEKESAGQVNAGWASPLSEFVDQQPNSISEALKRFVADASPSQIRAWEDSIPPLQRESKQISEAAAGNPVAIMEYQLPMEFRRADFVLLARGAVFVLELKGKDQPTRADIDQAAGYARDLRAYHAACADREVWPVLVPMRSKSAKRTVDGVAIIGPDSIDDFVAQQKGTASDSDISVESFLSDEAYSPLPSIIEAARELMETGELRYIRRAHAATAATMELIRELCIEAAKTKTRKLILLRGAPGSGKTLVGLQLAHSRWLDDIAVERASGKRIPAVFLSGNGPLVDVLQYQLKAAGGDGKTFVRGVKEYVARYSKSEKLVPDEHVLIYDEAQRAWDARRVAEGHKDGRAAGKSEPELFIEFANRVPDWCVVVGLIGTGQEIHVGEEGGTGQWFDAVQAQSNVADWTIHGPDSLIAPQIPSATAIRAHSELSLDTTIRFHAAQHLAPWVEGLLNDAPIEELARLAEHLRVDGYRLYVTRDLEQGKQYLRDRYQGEPSRRYGVIASSRDRILSAYGVANDWQSTKTMRNGPWFAEGPGHPGSCTNLESVATEFGAQGLELDQSLLAWGSDLVRTNGAWSNDDARNYKKGTVVKSAFELRKNAYRVLLTRGRDGSVIFLPEDETLDETYKYLVNAGVVPLESD